MAEAAAALLSVADARLRSGRCMPMRASIRPGAKQLETHLDMHTGFEARMVRLQFRTDGVATSQRASPEGGAPDADEIVSV